MHLHYILHSLIVTAQLVVNTYWHRKGVVKGEHVAPPSLFRSLKVHMRHICVCLHKKSCICDTDHNNECNL